MKELKVALVHDFLDTFGGAERVLEVMAEMFSEAPIYTLLYDREKMRGKFSDREIHTSFLQRFPKFLRSRKKWLLPLLPTVSETFDLRDFDLVITSTGAWTKGIITRLNTIHVAYFHSPMRFVWDASGEYLGDQKKCAVLNFFARGVATHIRVWDKVAADRPDYIIANSEYTKERIKKYYGRDSIVIYPPALTPFSEISADKSVNISNNKDYFLVVSRLSPYKRIDAALLAFNKLELPLVVIGEGEQLKYLKKISKPNIKFLGWQPDEKVRMLMQSARAFIFPGVDDFGIAPVEAMGAGVPVVAIRCGGAKEIVIEGQTGEFFDAAIPEVIADGVRRFIENEKHYDRELIKEQAQKFSKERFVKEFGEYIEKIISKSKIPNSK